jgi:hypothetical protein
MNKRPDLQELVARFGNYSSITAQAREKHDAAMVEWQAHRREVLAEELAASKLQSN